MYKTTNIMINRELNNYFGRFGHGDSICICDIGLPIPDGVKCIDLSYEIGKPLFTEIVQIVESLLNIEDVIIANEFEELADLTYIQTIDIVKPTIKVSHEEFKLLTNSCKLIIRTGQNTAYANVILTMKPNF